MNGVIDDLVKIVDKQCQKTSLKLLKGIVENLSPLKIRLENSVLIDEDRIEMSRSCLPQRTRFELTLETAITVRNTDNMLNIGTIPIGTKFTVAAAETDSKIIVGTRVLLANCNNNQRYYILRTL